MRILSFYFVTLLITDRNDLKFQQQRRKYTYERLRLPNIEGNLKEGHKRFKFILAKKYC